MLSPRAVPANSEYTRNDAFVPPAPTLGEYLAVLKRRGWIVAIIVLVTPAFALFLTSLQKPVYEASAQVLIGRPNLATDLFGIGASSDPERAAATQEKLARLPDVAQRVLREAGLKDRSAGDFLDQSSVSATSGADLLTFSVRTSDPALAT